MKEEKVRLGIVVSKFNFDITYLMLQRALQHAKLLGAEVKVVVMVPGSFEIPLAVAKLLKRDDIDAVVALGAIIQGETKHDEIVGHQVARKLLDLGIEFGKPVTLGIIGPGATRAQAQERIDDYSKRAVEAAVEMVLKMRELDRLGKVEGVVEI
jgi:6,7-dimethyl-8-ribityllumazine synthase